MMGLFAEVGPCTTDGKTTRRVATSWSTQANLLFIDQPAGTGFSTVSRDSAAPVTLAAAGQDLNTLLHAFYTQIFPSLSARPLHFAGESFGGRYVPAYTRHMLQKQEAKAADAVPVAIESLVLVSAAVDHAHTALGQIDHFCSSKRGNGFGAGFDAATCAAMNRAAPECEKQGQACRESLNLNTCRKSLSTCSGSISKYFSDGVGPGGRNPYDGKALRILHGGGTTLTSL
jgi:cathepsin A (carboxypeptidase C)